MFGILTKLRRSRVRARPFPPEWLRIVERNVPMYQRLAEDDRAELLRKVQVFLAEKSFEGCGGLELTDEIRVTVAAQACIPVLKLDDYYPRLRSILVYPRGYFARQERQEGGIVHEENSARLGESWQHGALVLSWATTKRDAANPSDGHNVVLHEFAHQLDQEDGAADGTPVLPLLSYLPWARVLSEDYLELRRDVRKGRRTVLDDYGATNEAEFFAVATETFFEKPMALLREHPGLYEELRTYFRQDPAAALRDQADEPSPSSGTGSRADSLP